MVTTLLVIALAGMLVHIRKKIKGIEKGIHEIGINLAYIQANCIELGYTINEAQKVLGDKMEEYKVKN